jgi:hypothetical protein
MDYFDDLINEFSNKYETILKIEFFFYKYVILLID